MNIRIIIGVLMAVLLISFTFATSYYNFQCEKMSDGDVEFMKSISPALNNYHANYLSQHPITEGGIVLVNKIFTTQKESCMKKING